MDAELLPLLTQQIVVESFQTQDAYGSPTYAAPVSYAARVVNKVKRVSGQNGEERVSNTQAWVDTAAFIDTRSRVTLPAGFLPNQPPIIRIDRIPDENGALHTVIYA